MSEAPEGYKVIDGPLKGQWRVSDREYFEAFRLPPERITRNPEPPSIPLTYTVIRYTLTRGGGGYVWSCGQDA